MIVRFSSWRCPQPPTGGSPSLRAPPTSRGRRVKSPADPALGLNKPGVWGYVRSAEASLWTPSMVEYRGVVDLALLLAVRKVFGL